MRNMVAAMLMGSIIVLTILLISCSSSPKTTDGSDASVKDKQNAPLYYDFGDVLVPRELNLDAKSSYPEIQTVNFTL